MQYILTAEEMNSLVPSAELIRMADRADRAELLCEAYKETAALLVDPAQFLRCVAELHQKKIAAYEGKDGS